MQHEEPEPIDKEEAEAVFASEDPEQILYGLLRSVFYIDDWRWVQEKCLQYVDHPEFWTARMAVMALGHIATFHKTIDTNVVLPRLHALKVRQELVPTIEDAISDIKCGLPRNHFKKRKVRFYGLSSKPGEGAT